MPASSGPNYHLALTETRKRSPIASSVAPERKPNINEEDAYRVAEERYTAANPKSAWRNKNLKKTKRCSWHNINAVVAMARTSKRLQFYKDAAKAVQR